MEEGGRRKGERKRERRMGKVGMWAEEEGWESVREDIEKEGI